MDCDKCKYQECRNLNIGSPLTHVKDKEAEGSKHNGSNLFPVHRQTVSLCLVLE